jgi:hypothetical protein
MKLLIEAPINPLSFGNVTVNILKEMFKKNVEVGIFPIGNLDASVYSFDDAFKNWLQEGINKRFDLLSEKLPVFKLWHLNGGENRKSPKQHLLTFYECSEPTKQEVAVCKSQDHTFFSSTYARDKFAALDCPNVSFVPMGFDPDFKLTGKKYLDGVVHFGLMGKFENRKHTGKIIQTWLKKYGNNNKYQLSCCITNPFFKPEQMQGIIQNLLQGQRYTNVNFLPYLSTNAEVNDFLNAIDIDLTGLSGGEGWNLPSFNATCLGKWSIVLNETSHKDWATSENSILIESNGTIPVHDGVFFSKDTEFNQGVFYTWDEDVVIAAMEEAEKRSSSKNKAGLELGEKMTYSNTVDQILGTFFAK